MMSPTDLENVYEEGDIDLSSRYILTITMQVIEKIETSVTVQNKTRQLINKIIILGSIPLGETVLVNKITQYQKPKKNV